MSNNTRNLRISFFGAPPDTGNLGVSALYYATLFNLLKQEPNLAITVFDFGRGVRSKAIDISGQDIQITLQGAFNSRRYYLPENLWAMKFLGKFGGMGNNGITTIKNSNAVLDISAGDSFTDLYGSYRFQSVTLPKLITLQQKIPLILLPQTYGPFKSEKCRNTASYIVKNARTAWARDKRSFEVLQELLGKDFDPKRHKSGVDVAFGLPAAKPDNLPENLAASLSNTDVDVVGINISGLIYNNPYNAKHQFGFRANYNEAVGTLVRRFLHETDSVIALTPHVVSAKGGSESDLDACRAVLRTLGPDAKKRVVIVPSYSNPCEIKWVIGKCNWFCGTRMHATIAALSTAVPTSAISYSPKTLGVFETSGQGNHVADPQKLNATELVEQLWQSWENRDEAKKQFTLFLPQVFAQVDEQITSILELAGR